ncbi:hypothetical protein [Helicobacter sp. MIT 01-3238]|uniref:hypothetical protein n=1 Tax=Helicobacter sp. MIT 01-3238 TaxID=398627 RepID=UPI000E1EE4BB|nr:hypothetical protein [Helicobacter sp. MIT 01-3238]RDU53994.1 hypothetical protein CQA40_04090 [Helicobacter sp. MIT 01-3238]
MTNKTAHTSQKSSTLPKASLAKRAKSATLIASLTPLQIFERLCEIPHKSYHTQEMFDYLCGFCESLGLKVRTDRARNIYICKKPLKCEVSPKICLQAHYDMVGVGRAQFGEAITPYVDSCGFLRARESSLGADNGVGVASILWLFMQERYAPYIEAILTNDEEVGLCGANELELPIKSNFLLNLDSEFFGEIIIGCAGGFDVEFDFCVRDFACADSGVGLAEEDLAIKNAVEKEAKKSKKLYEIKAFGFEGGHSGVDIHRNIRSSIVEFARLLEVICECCGEELCELYDLRSGEKPNSIPVGLEAIMGFSLQGEDLQRELQKAGLLVESGLERGSIHIYVAKNSNDTKNEEKNNGIKTGFLLKPCSNTGDYKQILEQKPYDKKLLSKVILALNHGVWERGENGEVLSSLNIAMIEPTQKPLQAQKLKDKSNSDLSSKTLCLDKVCDSGTKSALHFTLKARANTNALLKSTKSQIVLVLQSLLESHSRDLCKDSRRDLQTLSKNLCTTETLCTSKGSHISKNDSCANIAISNEYGAWEKARDTHAKSPILQMIIQAYKWRHCEVGSIHAGLECGILQERFAKMGLGQIAMASIGPTILSPHSLQERLDLGSFDEFVAVLVDLLDRICASKLES